MHMHTYDQFLNHTRASSGLLKDEEEEKENGKAKNKDKGKKKSKEELKREKKEQKEKEKKEKARKRKEEKRLKLLMQAEQEELDAERANNNKDDNVNDNNSDKEVKKEKKVWAKLKYRIQDMQKHAMIVDSIGVSEVRYDEEETPIWEMQPSPYNFDDIEDNTIDDLDLPEIHHPHHLTTRIMLTVPQLVGSDAKRQAALERASSSAMGSRGNSATNGDDEIANAFNAADFGFSDDSGDTRYLPQPADATDHIGKYEERVAIATDHGVHIFSSSLAVIPYDTWTHVAIVCSEDPRLQKNDKNEWRPSSRMQTGSRPSSTRDSKRPSTAERREEERIHRMLAGGPEDTPPSSPREEKVNTKIADVAVDNLLRAGDNDNNVNNDNNNDNSDNNDNNENNGDGNDNNDNNDNNDGKENAPTTFLSLYVNGVPAGEVRNVTCNLPMKSIGADEFSFHGCLLDVRYWHKARSRKEIQYSMNRLLKLPDHKPLKGLIGWWTFEDGWGEKVTTDVSEQRFRVPIRGFKYDQREKENKIITEKQNILIECERKLDRLINSGATSHEKDNARYAVKCASQELSLVSSNHQLRPTIKTEWAWVDAVKVTCSSGLIKLNSSQLEDQVTALEVIPTPSYRVSRYCPYEIKRFKLAQKGRTLWNIIQCPNACGVENLRKMDLRFHLRFLCDMRRVTCRHDGCDEVYPLRFQEGENNIKMHTHTHTHTHIYIYIYIYIYSFMNMFMHTHTYVHTCTHIHTHIHRPRARRMRSEG